MIELVQKVQDNGSSDTATVGILGENWADSCDWVWK